MIEKRLLLAVALSIAFLLLWTWFFAPPPAERPAPQPAKSIPVSSTPAPQPGGIATPEATGPATASGEAAAAPSGPGASGAPPQRPPIHAGKALAAPSEEILEVDTPLLAIRLTNRGGRITSWKLKKYPDDKGAPLDLVSGAGSKLDHLPLQLLLDDEEATKRLTRGLYAVARKETTDAAGPATEITFSFGDGAGLEATKTIRVSHVSYLAEVTVSAAVGGRPVWPTLVWGAGFGPHNGIEEGRFSDTASAVADLNGTVVRIPRSRIKTDEPLTESGRLLWAGLEDRYFAAILVPAGPGDGAPAGAAPASATPAATTPAGEPASGASAQAGADRAMGVPGRVRIETLRLVEEGREQFFLSFALGAPGVAHYHLFVGPKDYDLLRNLRLGVESLVNFGFFSWFAMPLFYALKFIDRFVGNFGWAIVILTALIRVLFFPLMHRSQVKMRQIQEKMKRVQPKLKALRERYHRLERKEAEKGNVRGRHQMRQKMNEEMMQMYKEEGINPLGSMSGCLPMLLQLPFLWAFYQILLVAIELRRAPFVGYLKDLSQKDPYYITPIIMGITMLVQQKMTASSIADPAQRRMMYLMPIMFTYFFLNLPSGLVLYWLTSNLLGIGQQYLINRQVEAESKVV